MHNDGMTQSLDALGILAGTDKGSLGHDYLSQYERIFGHLRQVPITLLEIGIAQGASLEMWAHYFPNAQIVGVDINRACLKFAGDRCAVEIGSQDDPQFLRRIGETHRPHVIIDDGSHRADHVVLTLRTLFPYLRSGGIYVAEDLHFHAGPGAAHWRGEAADGPQRFLLRLAELVCCPQTNSSAEDRAFAAAIRSVEFFYGATAIRKKAPMASGEIAERRELVERSDKAAMWSAFAIHVLNNTGDAAEAERCARRAIELDPDAAGHHHHLSLVLEHAGDLAGSLAAAEAAARLNPGIGHFGDRVAHLAHRYNQPQP